jgi:NTP pyrophosphatase (non-canonical NTP hydrolase)
MILSFVTHWRDIAMRIHDLAKEKGWWDDDRSDGEIIALCHSELSEALEGLRERNPQSDKIPDFTKVEEELADCVIRLMDFSEARGHRVEYAILAKHEFNKTRPHKHGKKF